MTKVKGKVTWIDVFKPTKNDIEALKKINKFHPIILDELLHTSARSRVEAYKNYLFLTYHLPIYDPKMQTSRKAEIDFLITQKEVITVHYEELEPLKTFARSLSNNKHFRDLALNANTARLTYYILQEIINFSMQQLKPIEENIGYITKEIFKNKEREMLQKISYTKRTVLDFQIINRPQEILLNSLAEVGSIFWGEDTRIHLSDLVGDHYKVTQLLENYREVIESLEATNAQLFDSKSNTIMQKFTILAFLTFPLVLVVSVFDVNSIDAALGNDPVNILLGIGIAVVITFITLIIFRKKGWL